MKQGNILTVTFPVYERFDFFERSLESVLNQTVKCDILVIDNFSSHIKFKETCERKGVKYIRNDKNIGLFPNWNKCMDSITTKYGMIFQDDNVMKPNFVEEFVNTIENYPDIEFYFTNFDVLLFDTGIIDDHRHIFPWGYMEDGKKIIEYGIKYELGLTYAFIIEVKKFSKYYVNKHGSNDWLWIYTETKNLKVFGNKEKLFSYGIHKNQDSKNTQTIMDVFISISYIFEILSNKTNSNNLKSKAKKAAYKYFLFFILNVTKEYLDRYKNSNDIYTDYFNSKISSNKYLKFVLIVNIKYRKIMFKIARRIYNAV